MNYSLDKKFLEMLVLLLHNQNVQLAKIVSDEENLPLHRVISYVPSTHQIKQMLQSYKPNHKSSSEESVSSKDSSSVDE